MLGISVAGALWCFARLRANSVRNEEYRVSIDQMDTDIKRLHGEGEKIQQQLTPEQQNLLIAAHKLVANKDFVWSRLFSDLESVLPGGVSASRIAVKNVFSEGDQVRADLDFSVLAHDYPAVQEMIEHMNNSGLFQAELRGQDLQKTERTTFTEYTLHVIYSPTYRISNGPAIDVAQNTAGGDQQ
jgi:Tfp pilus assembly protein PilN